MKMKTETEKVTYTPGPWDDASKYPHIATVRIFAGTHYLASVGNSDDMREQTEANARLIAAAPDLLAALRKTCHAIKALGLDPVDGEYTSILEQAEIAIAKAEG